MTGVQKNMIDLNLMTNIQLFIVSIYGVGETKYLCSEKCKEEMILDSIEDQKYNRKMKGK